MALFLVQHGKSLSKDVDPDQGLSEEGVAETKRIAEVAKGYNVNVASIKHSVKSRARTTAEIFATALNPAGGIQEITGIKPMDDVSHYRFYRNSGIQIPEQRHCLPGSRSRNQVLVY